MGSIIENIKTVNKLNRIFKDIEWLILRAKDKPLSKEEAAKHYARAVELFAFNFEDGLYSSEGTTEKKSADDVVNLYVKEWDETSFNPSNVIQDEIDKILINFQWHIEDFQYWNDDERHDFGNDEIDVEQIDVDKEAYYGYEDMDDKKRGYRRSVLSYIELKALKKLYQEDHFDLMVDSICFLPSSFDIESYLVEMNRTVTTIGIGGEDEVDGITCFRFLDRWKKRSLGTHFRGDSLEFYYSTVLGQIPLGVERYYKFPNALKANYDLCKLNNFRDIIKEMKSLT